MPGLRPMSALGPIGRLGRFAATHRRGVFVTWAIVAVGLGVLAPRVETALSGAGWQANGSESVKVREQLHSNFGGVGAYSLQVAVHSERLTVADPAFRRTVARVERVLGADSAVAGAVPPTPDSSVSRDRHTAIVGARAAEGPERNGRRGQPPQVGSQRGGRPRGRSQPDRRLRDVVGLQRSQPRSDDEVRADLLAGDAGDPRARLRLAGRRRAAADADDRRPDRLRRCPLPRHASSRRSRSGR